MRTICFTVLESFHRRYYANKNVIGKYMKEGTLYKNKVSKISYFSKVNITANSTKSNWNPVIFVRYKIIENTE